MAQLYGKNWTRRELLAHVGRIEQIANIKALVGDDGTERGTRLLEVNTGAGLCYRVVVDRALDIAACRWHDLPLAWEAPVGEVHPAYYDAHGAGWLRSFPGGLLTTCGLDTFGAPNSDEGEPFGLHGRISNLPAWQAAHRCYWDGDEYWLEISGEMRQARLFGENLVLQRRIRSKLGANVIELDDTVTNAGFEPQPHLLLYHFNLGFPLISPASQLDIPAAQTAARDAEAQAGLATWAQFQPPTPHYREQVFRHQLAAGQKSVSVSNPSLGLRLRLTYDTAALPHLFQWKQMGQGAYVLGIEPANSSAIQGRAHARQTGDLPLLAPGESRQYHLELHIG